MTRFEKMIGEKFNKLLVLGIHSKSKKSGVKLLCQCDCGNKSVVRAFYLGSGNTKSCGCLQKETVAKMSTIHGYSYSKIYNVWHIMKERCFLFKNKYYKNYGGRGITVCDEWLDPKVFVDWALNNGYEEGLQIDRIDNDGNYEPSNCRFVTPRENLLNQRLIKSNNTSGYRGIDWSKRLGKFRARVTYYGKELNIGLFTDLVEAAKARDKYIIDNNLDLQLNFK